MDDRISTLPVSILYHILSFLPTKQVFATSVLSKMWNPLCRSVPTLDFDLDYNYRSEAEYYSFVQSVYAAMLLRDSNQPIQTFRIRCRTSHYIYDHDQINVNVWVNVALQRNVEQLELLLSCDSHIDLPCAILRHRTLVVLKLRDLALEDTSSVDLPSLKILHLDKVRFLDNIYLAELLSGCPVLEDLEIKNLYCTEHNPDYLAEGEFKSLPNLVRADIHKRYLPLVTVSNVKFLSIDKGYSLKDVARDQKMDINDGVDLNPYAKDLIPVFHNLVHIELTFFNNMNWLDVIEVLNHCPKLQILIIDQDFRVVGDYEEIDWRYPDSVPKCISLHLKKCHLNNYEGSKGEVRFARYVMRNASFLRTMKVCVNAVEIGDAELEMLEELYSCTRCSPTCKLSFEIILGQMGID